MGTLIVVEATRAANELGITEAEFKASEGWLRRFKDRHEIRFKKKCGETGNVDMEVVKNWRENELQKHLAGYDPRDVFNADEAGWLRVVKNRKVS